MCRAARPWLFPGAGLGPETRLQGHCFSPPWFPVTWSITCGPGSGPNAGPAWGPVSPGDGDCLHGQGLSARALPSSLLSTGEFGEQVYALHCLVVSKCTSSVVWVLLLGVLDFPGFEQDPAHVPLLDGHPLPSLLLCCGLDICPPVIACPCPVVYPAGLSRALPDSVSPPFSSLSSSYPCVPALTAPADRV